MAMASSALNHLRHAAQLRHATVRRPFAFPAHARPSASRSRIVASYAFPASTVLESSHARRASILCCVSAVPDPAAARLDGARVTQLRATELLAKLLEAPDPTGAARQHVEALTEDFFMTASTYLTLVSKALGWGRGRV
jgi:hypothetical protein